MHKVVVVLDVVAAHSSDVVSLVVRLFDDAAVNLCACSVHHKIRVNPLREHQGQ